MKFHEDHASEVPLGTEGDEVLAAFRDAKNGLTEHGMFAVVTIRREQEMLSALEGLLLEGKINAELLAGVSSDAVLTVKDFVFRAVIEDGPNEEGEPLWELTEKGKLDVESRPSSRLFGHPNNILKSPGTIGNDNSN